MTTGRIAVRSILVLAAALTCGSVASAAPWQNIGLRKATLDREIDSGVSGGSLTRAEATRLRGQFSVIEQREAVYRRNGLTAAERRDLDARFKLLTKRVTEAQSNRRVR